MGPIRAAARYLHHFTRHACGKALLLTCWVARSKIAPDASVPFLWQSLTDCGSLGVKERSLTPDEDTSFANIRQNIGASAQGCSLNRISAQGWHGIWQEGEKSKLRIV